LTQWNLDNRKRGLQERGLFLSDRDSVRAAFLPFILIVVVLIAMAVPRLISGFQGNMPIFPLSFLSGITFIMASAIFGRSRPHRTTRGDFYLSQRIAGRPKEASAALVLGTALLGTAILADTSYDRLRKDLYPKGMDTGSDASSSTGCGSAGCGGGGGGGGCGGCGGGGGD
jgi:uncharacterized membrane protein YgcG